MGVIDDVWNFFGMTIMLNLTPFVLWLQQFPNELNLMLMYVFGVLSLGILYKFFGKSGVYIFMTLGVIIGNMQVLKAMQISLFQEPIAMGTVIFMITFLATDILAEFHGRAAARKAIWSGFFGIIFLTGMMMLTIGVQPLLPLSGANVEHFNEAHYAMQTLFMPAPALFIASLTAYLISQYTDVQIFLAVKKITEGRSLWLRSFVSTALSSLVDNVIFSVLAWKILAPLDIDTYTLIFTYILGTYVLRLMLTGLNAVVLYFFKKRAIPIIK